MISLLSTAYWPNLYYCSYVLNSPEVLIECHENFSKQSFRNRTQILSANGILDLSIPVKKNGSKQLIKDVEISYQDNWHINHWRAITSAYRKSAFFEYFEDDISQFYSGRYPNLVEYNTAQLQTILKILRLKVSIQKTHSFEKASAHHDLRESIHPKKNIPETAENYFLTKSYRQVFDQKFKFTPNLSILDMLFNIGLESRQYLSKL